MKTKKIKITKCFILSIIVILGSIIYSPNSIVVNASQSRKGNFSKAYSITGNGAQDMINVALAQQGKTGKQLGYGEDWCCDFICDVAELAGQSSAIPRSGPNYGCVSGLKSYVTNAGGRNVTSSPQPGDLVFWSGHVELVYAVSGGRVTKSIGGNTGSTGSYLSNKVCSPRSYTGYQCVIRPNYSGNRDPKGCLDIAVSDSPNTLRVAGWAFDPDEPNKSISVHVYIGGIAGEVGCECYAINADGNRPDVNQAYGISGSHGFDVTLKVKKTGSQPIHVYAINSTSGNNPDVGNKNVNIQKDTVPPVLKNVKIENITPNGYDVSCEVSDNIGIDRVEFPTWTVNNDQDDLIWHRANIKDGKATYHVNRKDHKNEYGDYKTHIYVYDIAGNQAFAGERSTDSIDGSKSRIVTLEEGKSPMKGTYKNHEYIVVNDSLTATQARQKEVDGYHLATITSEEEYNYIMNLISYISAPSEGYWLGANDNYREGVFQWETGEPFIYSKWPSYQPDNKDGETGEAENYFGIWSSGIWNDFKESYKLGYVLEKDPPASFAKGSLGDHEYYVSAEYLQRADVEKLQNDGWYLATITSESERNYVLSLINSLTEKNLNGYWLGGNDVAREGTFIWENSEPFSYIDWSDGEPTNLNGLGQNENYLVLYNNGKFNDANETKYLGYILERDPKSVIIKAESIIITSNRDETKDSYEDDTFKLTASILPDNTTDQGVKWESSDVQYATVDATGKVTIPHEISNSIKSITITATSNDGNATERYSFVVCPKSSCEHIWGQENIIKDSTCSQYGEKEFTCTKCGTTKIEKIEMKAHTAVVDKAADATCNKTGLTEGRHCSKCSAIIEEQKVIAKLSHEYDEGVVTTEPTTTNTGIKTYTCKLCGSTKEEIIPKLEENNKNVQSISLSESSLSLKKGTQYSLTVTVIPEEAENKEIKWSSKNLNVVMVNSDGMLISSGKGRTTITASSVDGNKSDICVVTVWDKYDKPSTPTIKSVTIDSIEVNKISGCEYSMDTINWQNCSIFTDLEENTEYTIFVRRAENSIEYYQASEYSSASIKTKSSEYLTDDDETDIVNADEDIVDDKVGEDSYQPESPDSDTVDYETSQKSSETTEHVYDSSNVSDDRDNISGIGVVSEDGRVLTDEEGKTYLVSEKLMNTDLKNKLQIADKISGGKYKITKLIKKNGKVTGGNVTYMAPYNKYCTKATAGATVKLGGVSFKITAINENAFKNCKKLTTFKAGGNVTTIGKNAFNGCSSLKSFTITSKNIKSIGANAFKGTSTKVKYKVPKNKLSKYSKMILKAGASKKAKITK